MTPQTEREDRLRADLASLRIERASQSRAVKPRTGRGRTRRIVIVAVLALVVLAIGWRLVRGRAVPVEIAYATAVDAGKMEAAPVLSGSGYIVTGERYVSIGVRVAGRIDRFGQHHRQ